MHEIKLSAPGKNAMSSELMGFIRKQLEAAAGAPVLFVGEGDAFSAGLNLKEVGSLDAPGMARFIDLLEDMVLELFTYPAPTVCCVNGHAIAGGAVLALCCDHRVATSSSRARIGLNEVAIGLRFPPRVLALAKNRLPKRHLEEVLLGAALHAPGRAAALGLVDEIADDPLAVAKQRLEALAAHPADAYAATKTALRADVLGPTPEERSRFEREDLPVWTSDAVKARIRALLAR